MDGRCVEQKEHGALMGWYIRVVGCGAGGGERQQPTRRRKGADDEREPSGAKQANEEPSKPMRSRAKTS